MGDEHPLLAQVALTVSPFIALPAATTLPYTYRSLPPSLPPSSTADRIGSSESSKPAFVVSSSGQAAHPGDIQASCQKLQAHLQATRDEARRKFSDWQRQIQERELAEKRRVAPGWLDRDEKILEPERAAATASPVMTSTAIDQLRAKPTEVFGGDSAEGEELDRAFGALRMR